MAFNLTVNQEKALRAGRRKEVNTLSTPLYIKLADAVYAYRACQIGADKTTDRRELTAAIDKTLEELGYKKL